MEILGIKFAPLNVPLKRRLETLAAAIWIFSIGFGDIWGVLFTFYAIFYTTILRYFMLLYFIWMYYDWDTAYKGGRSMRWVNLFRRMTWMRYFSNYFPVKLVKTVDLDPNRNYLFVNFPHGILCVGMFGAFGTDYSGQRDLFPGLEIRAVTLDSQFKVPLFREYAYIIGGVSSNAESIRYQLSSKPAPPYTGKATILVVGGAAESLECRPNIYRIVLKRRKGFVKLALREGAPLVPVFSFGETNTYDQVYGPQGSLFRRIQEYIRSLITVAPVIIKGRGFFQYSFGVLPRRTPVTVVVGSPIELPKLEEPTTEQIDEYHEKFIKELVNLFETNKHKYIENADTVQLELLP
ncbi:2-acylglycerol O-acyltransferase 2-A-like [Ceratina calcarata]|uniref:Acyltransferase n=1 Tax=Ceratina calcarata TaxID=156304 RepID=A0AAJ7ND94_9HYME|nr:2-acylglycerol O-acyltransferase 2-A-like [Ceratina calcarata]XP_017888696.1 2-acylglycerol O-acyltransferase 2-A-like [Ceratina calcarata]XP_026673608.1 2-acylglycerol O-acyltransferase 2-A-like [Ceratina calcarata]